MLQSFAQTTNGDAALALPLILLLVALIVVMIAAMWKVFEKAGKPGWAAIVPFYNSWVLAEVGGKPGWWGLLAIFVSVIPFFGAIASLVISIFIYLGVAQNFGKGTGFAILLILLPFIGVPMLAWGDAQYTGSGTVDGGAVAAGPAGATMPGQPIDTAQTPPEKREEF